MKPASCKSKGRTFQNIVAAIVRQAFDLPATDVRPAIMGEQGADLKLSAAARKVWPFAVECKKRETLNVWDAMKQAEEHAKRENLAPLLVFSRNRSQSYACVPLSTFVELVQLAYGDGEP